MSMSVSLFGAASFLPDIGDLAVAQSPIRATYGDVYESSTISDIGDLAVAQPTLKATYGDVLYASALARIGKEAVRQARFDASDLYGPSGRPQDVDICQDNLDNCYLVATLAAIADKQPHRIENAIQYDPATETFYVTLHKQELFGLPKAVVIPVTQQDLLDNIARGGGSTVDNVGGDGPIWPAVMETAYAKMNDGNWADGLDEGYNAMDKGNAPKAMLALTGDAGTATLSHGLFALGGSPDYWHTQISTALAEGRPVTLSTNAESTSWLLGPIDQPILQDGLVDDHVYSVERIYKDETGRVMVELRNPWGDNYVGEGNDTSNPVFTISLERLMQTRGFESFNIGPRP